MEENELYITSGRYSDHTYNETVNNKDGSTTTTRTYVKQFGHHEIPANSKLIDSSVSREIVTPANPIIRTKEVKETLADGSVVTNTITYTEQPTKVERRVYTYMQEHDIPETQESYDGYSTGYIDDQFYQSGDSGGLYDSGLYDTQYTRADTKIGSLSPPGVHSQSFQGPGYTTSITTNQKSWVNQNQFHHNNVSADQSDVSYHRNSDNFGINKSPMHSPKLREPEKENFLGICARCGQGIHMTEKHVAHKGEHLHIECFLCSECFQPFPDGLFYEFDDRRYCEQDFHVLFAPCCGSCREFIRGRVIRAANKNWHPECFLCMSCQCQLADIGMLKLKGRFLCKKCFTREKEAEADTHICITCHMAIEEGGLQYHGDWFHAYHFKCNVCDEELNSSAREVDDKLVCLPCHDSMGIPICAACHKPIEGRCATGLKKKWHMEHFVCAYCEKPFNEHPYFEKKGLAYCELHYNQIFGDNCFICGSLISVDCIKFEMKKYCPHHFECCLCSKLLGNEKDKILTLDGQPICPKCVNSRLPSEVVKRILKDKTRGLDVKAKGKVWHPFKSSKK